MGYLFTEAIVAGVGLLTVSSSAACRARHAEIACWGRGVRACGSSRVVPPRPMRQVTRLRVNPKRAFFGALAARRRFQHTECDRRVKHCARHVCLRTPRVCSTSAAAPRHSGARALSAVRCPSEMLPRKPFSAPKHHQDCGPVSYLSLGFGPRQPCARQTKQTGSGRGLTCD